MDKFKVSLYIRVSTDKQLEGDSLEEQEKELKKFCEYKKYLIHKVHIERGKSAKDTRRAEYQKLLADIQENKINAVVVKKLDRLSRSLLDFEEFMRIAQENEVEFISLKENFDTTNAMGKAMLRVALVFAQLEREQTAERITDVMFFRASQGLYNGGHQHYGYDVINKELVPHKQERKIVEFIFDKFIETRSASIVAKELNALGKLNYNNELWDQKQINCILIKSIYIGKIKWKDKLYEGVHQPLIAESKFLAVQDIFEHRKYHRECKKVKGLLRGLLYCGFCDCQMTPNYTRKKNDQLYYYYRCVSTLNRKHGHVCHNKYLKMDEADKLILDKILEYANEERLSELKEKINLHNAEITKKIDLLQAEQNELNSKLKTVSLKKEKYLDSLVANKFNEIERKSINAKIEDFTIQEKQIQADIYKNQYELSCLDEQLFSMDEFKREMIFLKINLRSLDTDKLREWLIKNIQKIVYENEVKIEFKLLKLV